MAKPGALVASIIYALFAARNVGAAVESQAQGTVESLPPLIEQVFSCGTWSESGQRGRFRILLASVSGGAGTEVYVQRVVESVEGSNQVLRLLSTTPIRELNNDHAQYQVSTARCIGGRVIALVATFEHDEPNVEHRIRLTLRANGAYTISDAVVRVAKLVK